MSITRVFEDIVRKYPDKVAIMDNDMRVTYRELDEWSLKIAVFINNNGLGKEDIVGINMNRSYLSVCAVLGILRSGAAFLPIDIKTPMERINFMLIQSNVKLTLIDDETSGISGVNVNHIIKNKFSCVSGLKIEDSNLAYVIFTSGSTGVPKGVMIEHGGMRNHLAEKIRILGLDCTCVVAHNAPISFDISVWQILAPLCVGGTIVVFSDRLLLSIRKFIRLVINENITILEVVPIYLSLIIDECHKRHHMFDKLKYVLSTGEELKKSLVKRWFELFENIPLINAYGPTEASDDITHCIITDSQMFDEIPIGKKINNIHLFVKNEKLEDCDTNQIGELWVSGICVARGYVGNDIETKKHFLVDTVTNQRIFKTGDLVTLREDGNYYYYGRKDDQIKMHGNRIELREIESNIMSFYGIRDVKVIYNKWEERLEALLIADYQIDMAILKESLEKRIPNYMIPTLFLQTKQFPLNINGKIDIDKVSQLMVESNSLTSKNDLNK